MFRKVLVANRGEIALRIVRTLREMEIASVAIFSDADADALYVQEADEAYRVGPPPAAQSYLDIDAILRAARESGAEAIHPGYGFLAENAAFAEAIAAAGLTFIGPTPRALRVMGDKVEARAAVSALGVPIVPGSPGPVTSVEEALGWAEVAGYPVAVKAAGGGGGRGIRAVYSPGEMANAVESAQREAGTYFKNPEVYLEKYVDDPRHVEIQVLADKHGHIVHLAERDCSVQRRHQKLIEEAPGPAVDSDLRAAMGEAAIRAARSVDYDSAGTVEFLLTREGEFYFLEMNTRVQVEHPVTEMVAGIDIVREMILAAAGEPISVRENLQEPFGHAIEVRINAEDPVAGFRPAAGTVTKYIPPGGPGVRMDSGLFSGYTVPGDYDSLIAKLIAWGPTREEARRRALRALGECVIEGVPTTIPFARAVLQHDQFIAGTAGTGFLTAHGDELSISGGEWEPRIDPEGKVAAGPARLFDVEVNRKRFRVRVAELSNPEGAKENNRRDRRQRTRGAVGNDLISPMNGTVIGVRKEQGATVTAGEVLFVIEAMKMENEIIAHRGGVLRSVEVGAGDAVEAGRRLAVIE